MAETRSKAAIKRKNSASSFISNLTTKIKKSKRCNVDISVPNLSSGNEPSTSQHVSCGPSIEQAQSKPIQSTLLQYNFFTDAEEDPICFDSSNDFIFDYDEPETREKEEHCSLTKEVNNETKVLNSSSVLKPNSRTGLNQPDILQDSSKEFNDAEVDSTDSKITPGVSETMADNVAVHDLMSACLDIGVLNVLSHETSSLDTLNKETSVDSGNNNPSKQVDSDAVNINSECPMAKIYQKTFGGLSKVVEEMKNINNLIKKIQEELQKFLK